MTKLYQPIGVLAAIAITIATKFHQLDEKLVEALSKIIQQQER